MPVTHPSRVARRGPVPEEMPGAATLAVTDLRYAYPDGRQALDGVSVEIRRGDKVALVGPNGAGKTTLLLHLNGILRGQGTVRVNGLALDGANLPWIRAKVGMVFQNPDDQLFSPTVYEDVAFGPLHMGCPEDDVHRRVADALARVDMAGYGERLSHHLSSGEKKRIAIATVLAMSPEVLVLDEPSAGLDPRARRHLIELLDSLAITMLVATHDMAMVRAHFGRTIVMDEGRLVADGPTAAVFADPDFLETHGLELP